jgi:thiamine-monophosphate kinase
MMDLSDGLAKDLSRLCAASAVGARIELAAVPISPALVEGAATLGLDARTTALGGGEDYELLATLPPDRVEDARETIRDRTGVTLATVGTIIDGEGVVAVDEAGDETPLVAMGWDHFGTHDR